MTFAKCGILVVPPLAEDTLPLMPEALAAGVVVLGNRHAGKVWRIVRDGVIGWIFDLLRPDNMLQAPGRAFGSSIDEFDRMREATAVLSSGMPGASATRSW